MRSKKEFLYIRLWCIVCALCLLVPTIVFAQKQQITVDIQNKTLGTALQIIGKQSQMDIAYSKEFVDPNTRVSIRVKEQSLEKVLQELLSGTNVAYKIERNSILLYNSVEQKVKNQSHKKVITITGTVTDKITQEPIIGATIRVVGTMNGTTSDVDGNYTLKIEEGSTIACSYIGYGEERKVARKSGNIDMQLSEDAIALSDVVVVGYGVQKKVNLTGAVSMVKGDVLESRPIVNIGSGLQGLLPGVTISSSSGQPGAAPDIKIRGVSTINSSTSPLILIDGVAGGDMNLLNPSDIESVSVLKDAASASIYGARAANGVILITTKKGRKQEKATVIYQGYVGLQTPTALPKQVNGRQYMELSNEAMAAAGFSKPYGEDAFIKYDLGEDPNDYSNTDWVSEVFKKNAMQTGHSVSVRGGSEKSGYFMSYGYLDQNGLVVGDAYRSKRHNARINLYSEVNNRLKLNGTVSFVDYYRSASGSSNTSGVFRLSQRISPLVPTKWKTQNDNNQWIDTDFWSYGSVTNPLYVAYEGGTDDRKSRTLNAIVSANLKLIEGLYVDGQYSTNYYWRETDKFMPTMPKFDKDGIAHPDNASMKNMVTQAHQDAVTQSLQMTLNYSKTIGKHGIGALLGYSQEWYDHSSLAGSRKNILLDDIYVLDAGTEDITNGGNKSAWALQSYFGRINYAFAEKYLFEANMRIDGTSRFAKNNRWGYFPSFSVGWNFTKENFMEFSKKILESGKLRASWGELGNQNIGSNFYPYLTPIEHIGKSYPIGNLNNVGFAQLSLGNKDIKWETIRMLNVGVDLTFLRNRLQMTFDWFKKENINALVKPVYPTIVGVSSAAHLPFENMGRIENKGWELDVSWRDQIGEWKYKVGFNISDSKNKITDLGKSEPTLANNIRRVGDPINAYYGFLTDGLAQISDFEGQDADGKYIDPKFVVPKASGAIVQPGDIKYRDISGPEGMPDGIINENDKVVFGEPYPHYTYSMNGYLSWRGWDFSFYLQGVGKVNGYLADEARHCFINDYSVPKVEHLDRWTPNNPNASYPRLYQGQTHNLLFSDYWLEDASYLRLKNIQLGYTFPKKWITRLGMSNARAYVSADNLLTFTNYFGAYDPEVRETSGNSYPQLKTYVFGVSVSF